MYRFLYIISVFGTFAAAAQPVLKLEEKTAAGYFAEARSISDRDNGKLWGEKLYGPMIFVDKVTGIAIANEQDSARLFKKSGPVFSGKVPGSFGANTALNWGGKVWTVVLWPLPGNKQERAELMMHELFHRFQLIKKLPAYSPVCDHLDKMEGRLLLKLELEALRAVVNAYPRFSVRDMENAVTIRLYRYQRYPGADSSEHLLELNEGLATYTGFLLSGRNTAEIKKAISNKINEFYTNETFVRSFAYITGCIYGLLLKDFRSAHTLLNEQTGFEDLLMRYYGLRTILLPEKVYDSIAAQNLYDHSNIYAFEKARHDKWLQLQADHKRRFVDGPVLELPNVNMRFNFNPNEVQVLEGYGPVYPKFSATADWGTLEVVAGGVFVKDWMYVYIPLPPDFRKDQLKTTAWQIVLNSKWMLVEGKRPGDFKVVPADKQTH